MDRNGRKQSAGRVGQGIAIGRFLAIGRCLAIGQFLAIGLCLAVGLCLAIAGCQPESSFAFWEPAEGPDGSGAAADDQAEWQDIVVTEAMQEEAVRIGIARLVEMEEGPDRGEWPYEGVYRVRRQIPIGYRVGGTSIVCEALLEAPGWDQDQARREAIARGVRFVLDARDHPLMRPDYDGGYDVRGWGYTTALSMLVRAKESGRLPEELVEAVDEGAAWYLKAIEATEIPQAGGWNYARRPGRESVSPPSSFMTAMTILALLDAKNAGMEIDDAVFARAITFLEASRAESGEYVYSGTADQRRPGGVPGATGRMLIGEVALHRAGRGSAERLAKAVDAFIEHWDELEKRRAKPGTHEPPYGVAPYYFYFAHRYAAEAVELLGDEMRPEKRASVLALLWRTRNEADGTWNDRVFTRSANYGTAMSVLAILAPQRAGGAPE